MRALGVGDEMDRVGAGSVEWNEEVGRDEEGLRIS